MVQNIFDSYVAEQKSRCEHLLSLENNNNTTGVRCPPSFDRLLCWPSTGASETAILPCPPSFAFGYNPKNATASKICLSSGRWYKNLDGVTWSNYSQCRPPRDEYVTAIADITELSNRTNYGPDGNLDLVNKWLSVIKTVSQIGYASSFTTLVIALVIFSFLRKLRNSRNRLHKHLFVSFIMRAFMALLKDWLFVGGVGLAWDVVAVDGKGVFIKEHNTWICKAITSVWQYFIVANYAWILMEGLYLHNLVFLAFCSDTTAITLYVSLGWGLPCIVVIPWIAVRIILDDTLCWTTHTDQSLFLIIRIPIMISILFNFILFLNIVRVLLAKLKTSLQMQRKKMRYRRWAKSTLVLVPLFGAHYTLFLGLSYHKDYRVELVWLFCDQLFASFQGTFVALLYCLLNGEVRAEMKRVWKARKSRRGVNSLILAHRDTTTRSFNPRSNCYRHRSNCERALNPERDQARAIMDQDQEEIMNQ
ncbi:secretin receptor isoform X2 [Cephus cinctus]|nr:secretin receptor isoform X2 [Cephus cinctus]